MLGSKRKNILNLRLNHSRAYGQLESYKHKLILKWIDELIARRFLYVTAEEYPKLKITEKGLQALKNGSLIALRELAEKPKKFEVISAQDELVTALSTERQENKEFNSELYEKLRDWRLQKAKSLKLPAYCILHNSTLKEISSSFPCNLESLEKIKGMGENKIEQFGSEIIDLIQGNLQAIKKKVQKTTKVNIHQKEIEDLLHQLEQEKKLSPKKAIKILNKLASYGYEQAIPKLLKLLKSNTNNAIIMKKVVEALGQLGNRSAIPELEDLLSDPSPIIRRSVVESLGKLRAIELKSKLQHMSEKEESEFVRFAAHDALELINEIDSPKEEHVNYIKESDEHDHDYFIRKIENSNIPVRSKNVLKANVKNVHSFLNLKPFEILRFKKCGRKSVREILQFQDELHKEYKIKLNGSHYSGPRTVSGRAKLTF